jgi:hypothetical protein
MSIQSKEVRDETTLIKEDCPYPWVKYIGRAYDTTISDSTAKWQICRITKEGSVTTKNFANVGNFTAKWSLRTTYFPAVAVSYSAFAQSLASNFTSDNMAMGQDKTIAIQACFTGNDTATGTLIIESSVDGVEWCEWPTSSETLTLAPGCKSWEFDGTGQSLFRVKYTNGSNTTGTVDIAYTTKGSGVWSVL